jgi:hypothetical protein
VVTRTAGTHIVEQQQRRVRQAKAVAELVLHVVVLRLATQRERVWAVNAA